MEKKQDIIVEEHHVPDARHVTFTRIPSLSEDSSVPNTTRPVTAAIIIILILVIIGLFSYIMQQARLAQDNAVSTTTTVAPVVTKANSTANFPVVKEATGPSQVDVSSWQKFSNPSVSFTFSYPANYVVMEQEKNYFMLKNDANKNLLRIDARLSGLYANYQTALSQLKASNSNAEIDEVANGVRISSTSLSNSSSQVIYLFRYKTGALELETDASSAPLLDQIVATLQL